MVTVVVGRVRTAPLTAVVVIQFLDMAPGKKRWVRNRLIAANRNSLSIIVFACRQLFLDSMVSGLALD